MVVGLNQMNTERELLALSPQDYVRRMLIRWDPLLLIEDAWASTREYDSYIERVLQMIASLRSEDVGEIEGGLRDIFQSTTMERESFENVIAEMMKTIQMYIAKRRPPDI